jgi:hypothetical protein
MSDQAKAAAITAAEQALGQHFTMMVGRGEPSGSYTAAKAAIEAAWPLMAAELEQLRGELDDAVKCPCQGYPLRSATG